MVFSFSGESGSTIRFQLGASSFPADLLIQQQRDRHALQRALRQTHPANNVTGLIAYVFRYGA